MEQLFSLLQASPVLSIVLIFVLVMFLSYVFKDTIVKILKKRFDLYDEDEVKAAYIKTENESNIHPMLIGENPKPIPISREALIKNLKELKK